jgi:hypothetical protein
VSEPALVGVADEFSQEDENFPKKKDYSLKSSGGRFSQVLQISNANPHFGVKNLAYSPRKFLD